ncbi:MAG: Maf family protein [Desulfoprunum sp.]|nr:Maf family protein [Desulfoprunum sp.]
MFITRKSLVLASNSPRRREYFRDLGLRFTVHSADIDEQVATGEGPEAFVQRMAREKAMAVRHVFPDSWIVAADTVVCLDQSILGKPRDGEDAVAMLMSLAGREHVVRTGYCVTCEEENVLVVRSVATSVWFNDFSSDVAWAYTATGEPLDKAGAYGIQGRGAFLVEKVEGSYSNVVGLPLCEVLGELIHFGVITSLKQERNE